MGGGFVGFGVLGFKGFRISGFRAKYSTMTSWGNTCSQKRPLESSMFPAVLPLQPSRLVLYQTTTPIPKNFQDP